MNNDNGSGSDGGGGNDGHGNDDHNDDAVTLFVPSSGDARDSLSGFANRTTQLDGDDSKVNNALPSGTSARLRAAESKLTPIKEHATSVIFPPKLADNEGLYLVGAGVRKKSILKIYAVAVYGSPAVLTAATASRKRTLGDAARKFDALTTAMTSFVLEMVYPVSAEKVAGAIAESVKPRYGGSPSDISALESLIIRGVTAMAGGQAKKGTVFRFDCSEEGVAVTVNGALQGMARFDGLGSAFVDVFMDENAVSPTLVDSCLNTWSSEDAKTLAASLLELSRDDSARPMANDDATEEQLAEEDVETKRKAFESQMQPFKEYTTGIVFDPILLDNEGLYLVGAGVRKKSIIKVYAVAMYSSAAVLAAAVSPSTLRGAARTFDPTMPTKTTTTFVLEMVHSVGAEKIAGAIAESVRPRYRGLPSDIDALELLIVEGVKKIGGHAVKGTVFQFNCSVEGVSVAVDGNAQGTAEFEGLGSAFVDVFMDDDAVSPTLVDSCLKRWSSEQAMALALSLLELSQSHYRGTMAEITAQEEEQEMAVEVTTAKIEDVESEVKPIQEYATNVIFAPKLDEGLYLVGAGVRKKSIIKIYAHGPQF